MGGKLSGWQKGASGARHRVGGARSPHIVLFAAVFGWASLSSAAHAQDDYQRLLQDAERSGSVRVIVDSGWEVITGNFGPVDYDTVVTGAREIRQKHSSFLRDLESAGVNTSDARTLSYAPVSAMTVSAEELRTVKRVSSNVQVTRDSFVPLTLAQSTSAVGVGAASQRGMDGRGWMVAVLDSGVARAHPFFEGRVVREACFARICPNGEEDMKGPGAAAPIHFHGNHVAGIVAGNNGRIRGIAPGAGIIGVQVFSESENSGSVGSYVSHQLLALEWIYELVAEEGLPIAAVNLSLGSGRYTQACAGGTRNARRRQYARMLAGVGVVLVAASGNGGYAQALGTPACVPGFVSVGAVDDKRRVAKFSNGGDFLDILAPGVEIESAKLEGRYGASQGTSMAAPHVAGAVAVLRQYRPDASPDQIVEWLKAGARVTDHRTGASVPFLDLEASLTAADSAGTGSGRSSGGEDPGAGLGSSEGTDDGGWEAIGG